MSQCVCECPTEAMSQAAEAAMLRIQQIQATQVTRGTQGIPTGGAASHARAPGSAGGACTPARPAVGSPDTHASAQLEELQPLGQALQPQAATAGGKHERLVTGEDLLARAYAALSKLCGPQERAPDPSPPAQPAQVRVCAC